MLDSEKRIVELYLFDGKFICIIRFSDVVVVSDWFNVIYFNVILLLSQCIVEVNQVMILVLNLREIKYIGWFSEQVQLSVIDY